MRTIHRVAAVTGAVLLIVVLASIADSLLRAQHPCEKCGKPMTPVKGHGSIYQCPDKGCGFMVDEAFQR